MAELTDPSQLNSLLESAQLLHSSLELDGLLRHLLRSVMARLVITRAFIAVAQEDEMKLSLIKGLAHLSVGSLFDEAQARAAGITHIYPIGDGAQPVGRLALAANKPISHEEEQYIKALLGLAASGIANSRAHAHAQRVNATLDQKLQDLSALLDMVRGLTATLETEDVARLLVLTLAGRWAVTKYAIVTWKEGHATVTKQKGIKPPDANRLTALLEKIPEAMRVCDLPDGEDKEQLLAQQAVIIFPIRIAGSEGESISGCLILGPRAGQLIYTESDLEFGAGLVAQAAVALQNSWYFREMVEKKKLEAMQQARKQTDLIFTALSDVLSGTVLDEKYRLEEKIGSGGFGAVYRAKHLLMNRAVAVKILRPTAGNDTQEMFDRFRLEGISASRIEHVNTVAILDFGVSRAGIAYLVMELLDGLSLAKELRVKNKIPPWRCLEILLPVANVLAEAHALGIVHRDIKPDNIFLHQSKDGEIIKLVDFGIAKMFAPDEDVNLHTLEGDVMGTPAYMPPERIRNKPYDGRADIYSLGVLFYEMLCGELPFVSFDGSQIAMAMMHITQEPESLRVLNPAVPEEFEQLVLSMLQKNPEKRPAARELAETLLKLQKKYRDPQEKIVTASLIPGKKEYERITSDQVVKKTTLTENEFISNENLTLRYRELPGEKSN